jgi:hypothetical protein
MPINTVIEGCNGEDRTLNYLGYELFVPENALALGIDGISYDLLLSGRDFDLFFPEKINRNPRGRYPINPESVKWAMTVQRSLITSDGRIYVSSDALKNHPSYFDNYLPIIIEDCLEIFKNGIKPTSLSRDFHVQN